MGRMRSSARLNRRDSDVADDRLPDAIQTLQTIVCRRDSDVADAPDAGFCPWHVACFTRASESDLSLISYSYLSLSLLSPSSAVRQREDGERSDARASVWARRSSGASDQTIPDAQTKTVFWGGCAGLIADRLVCFSAYAGRRDVRLTGLGFGGEP